MLRAQSVTRAGALISPSAPVSGTGTGFCPLPSRERGRMVGVVLFTRVTLPLRIAGQVRNDGVGRGGWCCHLCLVMAKSWFYSPFR